MPGFTSQEAQICISSRQEPHIWLSYHKRQTNKPTPTHIFSLLLGENTVKHKNYLNYFSWDDGVSMTPLVHLMLWGSIFNLGFSVESLGRFKHWCLNSTHWDTIWSGCSVGKWNLQSFLDHPKCEADEVEMDAFLGPPKPLLQPSLLGKFQASKRPCLKTKAEG